MKKSKFLTFIFSICPGVGHLYLALFKQGVEIMILFFGVAILTFSLEMPVIGFLMPIIWFYSMFDALNKCSNNAVGDSHLEIFEFIDFGHVFSKSNTKYIGIGLIALGCLCIFNVILPSILNMLFPYLNVNYIMRNLRTAILAILLILGGVKMLRKALYSSEKEKTL